MINIPFCQTDKCGTLVTNSVFIFHQQMTQLNMDLQTVTQHKKQLEDDLKESVEKVRLFLYNFFLLLILC